MLNEERGDTMVQVTSMGPRKASVTVVLDNWSVALLLELQQNSLEQTRLAARIALAVYEAYVSAEDDS